VFCRAAISAVVSKADEASAMGNPATDPYADLLKAFHARRQDYLYRLTTDEATLALDPEANGAAQRRGFLKGHGPRPVCSLADQDAAGIAADENHHLVVWTDSACLRAGIPEPWDGEDVRSAIARLAMFPDKDEFQKRLVIPEEPPDPSKTGFGFRPLMRLLRQMTVCGRSDFRAKVRVLLASARDGAAFNPDFNPVGAFDNALIEEVVESLSLDVDPGRGDLSKRDELRSALAARTLDVKPFAIDAGRADKLLDGLFSLLGSALTAKLVTAAIEKGRPGPYNPHYAPGAYERPPDSYDRPPDSEDRPPSTYEPPPSSYERPPDSRDNPNPAPPPPRSDNTLFQGVWEAMRVLSWFGTIGTGSRYTVRDGALAMAAWIRSNTVPAEDVVQALVVPSDDTSLIELLFKDQVWIPPAVERSGYTAFVWPPYTREGIYWWRAVIKQQCIDQCYRLNETADFHSTDLIRFLRLFPGPDPRIPDYVYTAAHLALLWFKYWWDEPAAKDPAGNNIAEMTMWSENHQILFAQSQLLAGALFRDTEFSRSGDATSGKPRTGQDHIKEGLIRVERWLDLRLKFGFSEWNAPGYYNEDFPPIFNLVDFCDPADPNIKDNDESLALARIKVKAAMVLDLMVFDCARFTCRGSFGVTAGRAYWEHKCYGWEQSIGNAIEILFGTRGDFLGVEPAAVALATSTYDIPEALLAIGLDRVVLDQSQPFLDRTRVSIDFGNAADYNIGTDSEEDILFWWGLEAYYTDQTLESTKRVVEAHPNLKMCGPFDPLYAIAHDWLREALVDLISLSLDVLQVRAGVALVAALPFPLDLVAVGLEGKSIVDGVADFFKDLWDYLKSISKSGPWAGAAEGAVGGAEVAGVPGAIVGGVGGFFIGLFGDGDNEKPKIPDTALQHLLEQMLVAFNTGTVLSSANIVTFSNGDAMLSSVQNHIPGQTAFQKQPWMANLGLDACVWTTARFMSPDIGSYLSAWGRFFKDLGLLHLHEAAADVIETPIVQAFGKGDLFGHDGPNYWTGSLALPMIVQHENAAIIAYNLPALQRSVSGFSTHAWFPKERFDDTRKVPANGGTWFFGRKDHLQDGVKVGSGYVALFSAIEADWTNESGNNWNDKEIMTKPPGANVLAGSNIWISVVGNEKQYDDAGDGKQFDAFCDEIQTAYLNVSGVGSVYDLECSFDIPRAKSPAGRTPRLELFYGSDKKTGRFAGDDLQLDNFPRFENQYVSQSVMTGPTGGGIRPQVEGFTTTSSVGFGSTAYRITHPATGLTLDHDTAKPARDHSAQPDPALQKALPRRLQDGALAPVRQSRVQPPRTRPLPHPHLDVSSIRRRTP
jgi:hypothetical protein